jgi:hypothetical protein
VELERRISSSGNETAGVRCFLQQLPGACRRCYGMAQLCSCGHLATRQAAGEAYIGTNFYISQCTVIVRQCRCPCCSGAAENFLSIPQHLQQIGTIPWHNSTRDPILLDHGVSCHQTASYAQALPVLHSMAYYWAGPAGNSTACRTCYYCSSSSSSSSVRHPTGQSSCLLGFEIL